MAYREIKKRFTLSSSINVNDQWVDYSKAVFGDFEPSVIQYKQTKQAFYAGVMSMLGMNLQITNLSDDEGVAALQRLHRECESFFETQARI